MADRDLMNQIDLGIDAEAFLGSPLGKYLIGRAEEESQEALAALVNADPEDSKEIRRLQNQVYRAESIQGWIADAIRAGKNAEEQLIESER